MQTSPNGIKFIQDNEGFIGHIYNDVGHRAIGYGHDLQPGEVFSEGITQEQAQELLIKDLSTRFEPAVNRLAPQANQNQFDALVDFCYNAGVGSLTTMLSHGFDQVPVQILRWCYKNVNGKEVKDPVLKERRKKEVALFNTPI